MAQAQQPPAPAFVPAADRYRGTGHGGYPQRGAYGQPDVHGQQDYSRP